jgi:hypothetical protein
MPSTLSYGLSRRLSHINAAAMLGAMLGAMGLSEKGNRETLVRAVVVAAAVFVVVTTAVVPFCVGGTGCFCSVGSHGGAVMDVVVLLFALK